MNQIEHKIVDNVIYTSDVDFKLDPKGVGHYYYSKMIDNRNKIAQIDGCTKEEDTFGSLLQRSVRTALAMIEKGVKPGDHISLCTYNHLNSAVPYIASYFTGTIMGPIEPTMSVEEAAYLLRKTLPKIIFATPTAVPLVEKVIESIGTDTIIVVFGETSNHIPFSQLILPHEDEDEFKPYEPENLNELSLILFSSGTSGMPKAICFNHVNMLSVNNQNIASQGIVLYTIANPYWSVFPIFLHLSVELGSTRVVYPFFNSEEPWTMFYQHVDFGFLNSTQALRMVQSPKPNKINLKNVKAISLGGNPLTLNQLNLIESTLSHTIVRYSYSQTELFKRCFNPVPYGIADNVIYTPNVDAKLDPKGVGHYYYSKMIDNRNKIAQIDGCTKEEDTFGSLLQRSVRTALAMIDKRVKPGDHISLCTYNHLNSAVPYIASYFTGTIMGPIEPTMSVEEATYLLRKTLPKIIFATPTAVHLVEKVIESIGTDTIIVVFGETLTHIPFSQLILPHKDENEFKPYEPENLNELSLILFSSGTSGMPKAICFNHVSMLSVNDQNSVDQTYVMYTVANPYWSVFPIFLHLNVEIGSTRVVYPSFDNNKPWTVFNQYLDFAYLNSMQALRMVQTAKPDNINLKNVKVLFLGGNPLTLKQLNRIESTLLDTMVSYTYSQTELFKRCFNPIPYGTDFIRTTNYQSGPFKKDSTIK
ncbi:hypothetical protein FQR65_LT10386 [Abscondita terminalis]|nr:hypothetical protein FQR65_LT10386 [Abscondita terminalis]